MAPASLCTSQGRPIALSSQAAATSVTAESTAASATSRTARERAQGSHFDRPTKIAARESGLVLIRRLLRSVDGGSQILRSVAERGAVGAPPRPDRGGDVLTDAATVGTGDLGSDRARVVPVEQRLMVIFAACFALHTRGTLDYHGPVL